jgi:enamine deaminase RidA (YjgF/YER057c/UK114 family)
LQPPEWSPPKGYVNGLKAGDTLYLGGMIGSRPDGSVPDGFVEQARQALENMVAVVAQGGGTREQIVRMTWYVTDMDAYLGAQKELGQAYRSVMGKHYPAMTLVEVRRLVVPGTVLEIEATAVLS